MNVAPAPEAPSHRVFCILCFQDTARISITKKGLPTIYCRNCVTRSFLGSSTAVRGYFMMAPKAINAYRQLHGAELLEMEEAYATLKDTYGELTDRALASG